MVAWQCRICKSTDFYEILDLGLQALTGVFPSTIDQRIDSGPLELIKCNKCHLVQLKHSADANKMYSNEYGYRSGLNPTMVSHLSRKVKWIEKYIDLKEGDVVLDIGSNDGTLLNSFSNSNLVKIGIDPIANRFEEHYKPNSTIVNNFFSEKVFANVSDRRATVITSIAMFYDLEEPSSFVNDIAESLQPNGIWHFEQSYLPTMLRSISYDTICHEHLEYYALRNIVEILEKSRLKILDVQINSVNGGSFAITASKDSSTRPVNLPVINWLLKQEDSFHLDSNEPYERFKINVNDHLEDLRRLIKSLRSAGKKIIGYGASTKGNVLLQYCGLGPDDIECIADVNESKYGKFTPGTGIPIVSEADARALNPDYMLVLPWHFRDFIIEKETNYLNQGGALIFPLPQIEIIS